MAFTASCVKTEGRGGGFFVSVIVFSSGNAGAAPHSAAVIRAAVVFSASRRECMVDLLSLAHDVAAVDRDRLTGDIACGRAAEPQNSVGDLLRTANPSHGHGLHHGGERLALSRSDHLVGHRCLNEARTYGIDSNATCSIFESRALGESKNTVLGSVIGPAFGTSYESPKRRAIHDSSASLLAHLLQLELHGTPYSAEIDRHHTVVIVTGRIGSFCKDILNAGIVVGCIELSESGDSLLNHCFYLGVISHVTTNRQCLVTFGSQFFGCGMHGLLIPVRQHHGST